MGALLFMLRWWAPPARASLFVRSFHHTNPFLARDAPIKSMNEVMRAGKLLSPKQYERLGKNAAKIFRRDQVPKQQEKAKRKDDKAREKQERRQLMLDKEATVMTKGAQRRKMKAITQWAKQNHPEIWERIVAKISLRETLQGNPWEPAVLLSYEEMEEMKEKHKSDPRQWSFPRLAHQFGISAVAVSKIVHSSFAPTPEQRVKRWLQREEFKSIQTQFLRSIAKQERSKLIEADLQSRYGTLYSPPPTHKDPLIEKYTEKEAGNVSDSEEIMQDSDDEEADDRIDRLKDTHELELSSAGGMTSVYRRITAEAKATVEAKLENDVRFQRQFAQDVYRVSKKEQERKEKDQLFQKEAVPAPRTFFTMFREDMSSSEHKEATSQSGTASKFLRDKPWRQKHVTSKKSTRIKQWPGSKGNHKSTHSPLPTPAHDETGWPYEE